MKKILSVQFRHETNQFCPAPANEAAYRNSRFHVGEEIFPNQRGVGTELGAFLSVIDARDDVELIPTVALNATPSGPVTAGVYDFVRGEVARVIREQGPFDGVLTDLHGAMVAEGHHDGEGDLFEMIRSLVGWDIPLICTLDLHANITEKMARCANALIPYEEYPHTDLFETGLRAVHMMLDTLDGKIKPVMAYRRVPFLLPLFPTEYPEIQPLYEKARALETHEGALCVRFAHGFFPADIEEMGMTVLAIADGDQALADRLADELTAAIEAQIPQLKRTYPTLDEALDIALQPGEGPVVLADASDNPGAGGLGDSTHILRRILERGITGAAFSNIVDPKGVAECEQAGVGATIELDIGGGSDPVYSGGPLHVTAYVKAITDGRFRNTGKMSHNVLINHGKTAVLEIAGNTVLLTSFPKQPLDEACFYANGINPLKQKILVVKSAIHYRAAYRLIAREMIALSLPGYAVPVPEPYEFRYWKG